MEKQTAVEWYFKQMQSKEKFTQEEFDSIYEQAKAMHKQEIIEAYKFGISDEYVIGSQKYYNETFGK